MQHKRKPDVLRQLKLQFEWMLQSCSYMNMHRWHAFNDTKQSIVSETDLKKFVAGFLDIQYLKSKTIRWLRDDEKQVHNDSLALAWRSQRNAI